jgi:amino acid transporter
MSSQKKSLGYVSLALLNISAIISLRHLPAMAQYGVNSLFFYFVGAATFLIPIALVCAELASTWPERGGLYNWVLQSFGSRMAFLVVWWSWMAAIATILVNLTFLSVTLAYTLNPHYVHNHFFVLLISLVALWGLTLLNIFGMHLSSIISSLGVIAGTIIPTILITLLAFIWAGAGHASFASVNSLDVTSLFKNINSLFFYSSVVLGYAGIELAAFHATDARDPQRDYSKAILLSVIMIISLYVLGTLSIALVLPPDSIDLIGGLVQFFHIFFAKFGLDYLASFVSLTLAIGTLGGINTWLISPAKGIFAAIEHFEFPTWLTYKNKNDVPVPLLLIQALICSLLLIIFTGTHSIERCFWMLTALTTQFSLLLYFFMTLSLIRLRFLQPETQRPFKIPDFWLPLVTITSLLSSIGVIIISFIPVEAIVGIDLLVYELFFILGLVALSIPPFFFSRIQ